LKCSRKEAIFITFLIQRFSLLNLYEMLCLIYSTMALTLPKAHFIEHRFFMCRIILHLEAIIFLTKLSY